MYNDVLSEACAPDLIAHVVLHLFVFNDTATTEIYTLSLHDALLISWRSCRGARAPGGTPSRWGPEHLLGVRGVLLVAARGPGRGILVVARAGPQTRGYQNRTPVKPWGPGTMRPPPPTGGARPAGVNHPARPPWYYYITP